MGRRGRLPAEAAQDAEGNAWPVPWAGIPGASCTRERPSRKVIAAALLGCDAMRQAGERSVVTQTRDLFLKVTHNVVSVFKKDFGAGETSV